MSCTSFFSVARYVIYPYPCSHRDQPHTSCPEVGVRSSGVWLRWGLVANPHPAIRPIQAVFLVVGGGGGGLSTNSYFCLLSPLLVSFPLAPVSLCLFVVQPPPPPPRKAF